MKWISVHENLPETAINSSRSKAVLIWCEDNSCTYTAIYDHSKNRWDHFGGYGYQVNNDVTHWMPLPHPPEPEKGELLMTNTYTTKLDMKNSAINICAGDTRYSVLIDEMPELIESLKAEYERAKAIMGNPLLDTRAISEALHHYDAVRVHGGTGESLKPLVEFYQNTLVMLIELKASICEVSGLLKDAPDTAGCKLQYEFTVLDTWRDKIAAILDAHKQHMPEGL